MANIFGANDEALLVNSNHPNAGDLLYAIIPRSTTKFVEVVSGYSGTLGTAGAYDSDGYLTSTTTTRLLVEMSITSGPMRSGYAHTIITGWKRDMGQGAPAFTTTGGMRISTATAFSNANLAIDGTTGYSKVFDNASTSGPTGSVSLTGLTQFAFAHSQDPVAPAQIGYIRVDQANTNLTPTTATLTTGTNDRFDKVGFRTGSRYRCAFVFVFDVVVDPSIIDYTIDDPTLLISMQGGGVDSVRVDRGRTLGRGLGRGLS
jgi:hypothetical protein